MPRFTYRSGLPEPLPDSMLTTDAGWGCCYRCCQGAVANFLRRLEDIDPGLFSRTVQSRQRALSFFEDTPTAAFSIHALVRETHVKSGEWAQPSQVASAIVSILDRLGLHGHATVNCAIEPKDIDSQSFPLLLMVSLRCGMNELQPEHHAFVRGALGMTGSLGIVSGYAGSAYYFVGLDGEDSVVYFDPHVVQPAALSEDHYASFFKPPVKRMPMEKMNPSMLCCFICRDRDEAHVTLATLSQIENSPILYCEAASNEVIGQVLDIDELDL